jgi:hypothetical protein
MTPAELCKSGSEHGQQRALFAWCRMAEAYGFEAAWDDNAYSGDDLHKDAAGVPELEWFHAIPNGGSRGDTKASRGKQGAAMKAEGVKPGIPDTFLPLPLWGITAPGGLMNKPEKCILYCGLYIEMKREQSEGRAKGSTSTVQDSFIGYARRNSYAVSVCFTWDQAARELEKYIMAVREAC